MTDNSKRDEHGRLVLAMADRQGLDLQEMIVRAELSEDRFEHAVDRCMGCTQPTRCKGLLDSSRPTLRVPDFCRNDDLFIELKSL